MSAQLQKITPMLWFDGQAEDAARLYVSVFEDAAIGSISRQPDGSPLVVEFTLAGQRFTALNGGPHYTFSPAISFVVDCATQEEVDHYWDLPRRGRRPGGAAVRLAQGQVRRVVADRAQAARRVHERPGPGEGRTHHAGDAADEEAGHRRPQAGARRRARLTRRLRGGTVCV